jgi:hypothetical protein
MSSTIWTPAALSSELSPYAGRCWRVVEAQHRVSTLKLADTLQEQSALEDLIDQTKPVIPVDCHHLDYLLATPFRYRAASSRGSRFRRPGRTLGVYYAAERPHTAVAEMAFHRLLFFAESPDTPWPNDAAGYTAFAAVIATDKGLDLTKVPLAEDRAMWVNPTDYQFCHDLADQARAAGADLVRYESARYPAAAANVAILRCAAFAQPRPLERQTWRIRLSPTGVQAICEFPHIGIEFGRQTFATDPRIATLRWQR